MEDKQLDNQQSIELITRMIQQTRERVERRSALPFLLMGYMTVAVSVAVWFALHATGDTRWNLLWFLIPITAVIYMVGRSRSSCRRVVSTYVDRVVASVWWVFGTAAVLCSLLTIVVRLDILFTILMLMGLATALTGLVIRFRLCVVTGMVAALVLAPACLFVPGIDQCLVFAAAFVVMMVVPGHILDCKCRRLCSRS